MRHFCTSPDIPIREDVVRGEVRLAAEGLIAKQKGRPVPMFVLDRAMSVLERVAG